jgi:uncharacterized protein (DUF1697 family)
LVFYIALLRGINVGGHKSVSMSDLCDLVAKLGFTDAKSLLASGNLMFRDDSRTPADLERLLEAETAKRLDLRADVFVRTAREWKAVVSRNPFRKEAERDPAHLLVMFLRRAPNAKEVKTLQDAIKGPEIVRADGRHAYIVYPAGIGRSRLTSTLIEAKLGTRGTARNWNTVLKLAALTTDD